MVEWLKKEIENHGDQARIIPIERLKDLKSDIETLKCAETLNGFQHFITEKIYQFEPPDTDFEIRSVMIMASPVPAYAKVIFEWQGQRIPVIGLARSYMGKKDAPTTTKQYMRKMLKPLGYQIQSAPRLPLKRLAVRSGLASYGRNNICYVDGMGSFLTLVAYFSDLPCSEDVWHDVGSMERCNNCTICLKSCPTGAILENRFLIDNERCLSYFNERPDDFPEWLPKSAHHCLYDCLKCQISCPMNRDYVGNVIGPIEFDEAETEMLLAGKTMREFPPGLREKVKFLDMDSWLPAIPRNMRVLLEKGGGDLSLDVRI